MNGNTNTPTSNEVHRIARPDSVTWVCRLVILLASTLSAWVLFAPVPASAVPLLWTLDNVSFVGGGSASGSFIFDAQTGNYSDALVTTEGPVSGDLIFDLVGSGSADGVSLFRNADAPDFSGSPTLRLLFVAPLTDAGGIIDLELNNFVAGLAGCVDADCTFITAGGDGEFASGTVFSQSIAQVPEPGSLALFGAPLLSLFWLRRRKTQQPENML